MPTWEQGRHPWARPTLLEPEPGQRYNGWASTWGLIFLTLRQHLWNFLFMMHLREDIWSAIDMTNVKCIINFFRLILFMIHLIDEILKSYNLSWPRGNISPLVGPDLKGLCHFVTFIRLTFRLFSYSSISSFPGSDGDSPTPPQPHHRFPKNIISYSHLWLSYNT